MAVRRSTEMIVFPLFYGGNTRLNLVGDTLILRGSSKIGSDEIV